MTNANIEYPTRDDVQAALERVERGECGVTEAALLRHWMGKLEREVELWRLEYQDGYGDEV